MFVVFHSFIFDCESVVHLVFELYAICWKPWIYSLKWNMCGHDDVIKWKHFPRYLLAICAGNSPVPGEFLTQRPVTPSFDVFFDLRLNKRLSKQSWGWWLRRHRAHYDVIVMEPCVFCSVVRQCGQGHSVADVLLRHHAYTGHVYSSAATWPGSYQIFHMTPCSTFQNTFALHVPF